MSTWLTLILLFLTLLVPLALVVGARLRPPSTMAEATLDFTGRKRRAPHTRRPPPAARAGLELSFRVPAPTAGRRSAFSDNAKASR